MQSAIGPRTDLRRSPVSMLPDLARRSLDAVLEKNADDQGRRVTLRYWYWFSPYRLSGRAYGHPRFADGTHIVTSTVVWIDEDKSMAQTLNTLYQLVDRVDPL